MTVNHGNLERAWDAQIARSPKTAAFVAATGAAKESWMSIMGPMVRLEPSPMGDFLTVTGVARPDPPDAYLDAMLVTGDPTSFGMRIPNVHPAGFTRRAPWRDVQSALRSSARMAFGLDVLQEAASRGLSLGAAMVAEAMVMRGSTDLKMDFRGRKYERYQYGLTARPTKVGGWSEDDRRDLRDAGFEPTWPDTGRHERFVAFSGTR